MKRVSFRKGFLFVLISIGVFRKEVIASDSSDVLHRVRTTLPVEAISQGVGMVVGNSVPTGLVVLVT